MNIPSFCSCQENAFIIIRYPSPWETWGGRPWPSTNFFYRHTIFASNNCFHTAFTIVIINVSLAMAHPCSCSFSNCLSRINWQTSNLLYFAATYLHKIMLSLWNIASITHLNENEKGRFLRCNVWWWCSSFSRNQNHVLV